MPEKLSEQIKKWSDRTILDSLALTEQLHGVLPKCEYSDDLGRLLDVLWAQVESRNLEITE